MGIAVGVAVLVGVAIGVQVDILGRAGNDLPVLAVSLALLVAGLVGGSVWIAVSGQWDAVGRTTAQWWWLPLGIVGWAIVGALGYAAARIGVAPTLGLSVSAQLVVGHGLDLARGRSALDVRPLLGLVLLAVGLVLLILPSAE